MTGLEWHCGPSTCQFRKSGRIESNRFLSCHRVARHFLSFEFFPASCIYMRLTSDRRESRASRDTSEQNIVTHKSREFEAKKELNATSLRNQFYSIFWCVVLCFSRVNFTKGGTGGRKNRFYVSRFVSHQAFWICDFYLFRFSLFCLLPDKIHCSLAAHPWMREPIRNWNWIRFLSPCASSVRDASSGNWLEISIGEASPETQFMLTSNVLISCIHKTNESS